MDKTISDMQKAALSTLIAFVLVFALSACVLYLAKPATAKDPEVLSATEDEISIGAWGWSRPDDIASEHCRKFDKEAVFLSTLRADAYGDARIVYYRCQWPNY